MYNIMSYSCLMVTMVIVSIANGQLTFSRTGKGGKRADQLESYESNTNSFQSTSMSCSTRVVMSPEFRTMVEVRFTNLCQNDELSIIRMSLIVSIFMLCIGI